MTPDLSTGVRPRKLKNTRVEQLALGVLTMKSAIIFFTIALSLIWNVRETFAAGSIGARSVALTSLEACPGNTFEFLFEQGNTYNARALLTIICMWPEANQARWMIQAGTECELSPRGNGLCKGDVLPSLVSEVVYTTSSTEEQRGFARHNYQFKKGVIGRSCNAVSTPNNYVNQLSFMQNEKAWKCNEYDLLNDIDLYTLGTTGLSPIIGIENGTWRFEDNLLYWNSPDMPDPYMEILGIPSRYYITNL